MTENDFDQTARLWLEDGPIVLSDRALLAALDEIHVTRQRRAWWPARRFKEMNSFAKFAVAAAVVLVAALVGINLLPSQGNIAAPSASPSPSPSPAVSPPPVHGGELSPGAYTIGPAPDGVDTFFACPEPTGSGCSNTVRVVFTVPDGWSGAGDSIWLTAEENVNPDGAGLLFVRGGPLHTDPCVTNEAIASDGTMVVPDIPVGPTAAEFATALADHPLLDVTTPVDVSLAGYAGKYVDLQVPSDIAACSGTYRPWEPGLYAQGLGQRWHLWILDVDGQRVVVQSTDYAGTSAEHRAELQAIVDSVVIEP
jgi:hypothetical protein